MDAALERFGVFRLTGMQLALPLAALREVVPLQKLVALPCGNPAVLGGIDLRGLLVPVLDLRVQLGQARVETANSVVIMLHDGCLLGLLADGVSGVFECAANAMHPVRVQTGASLFAGSFAHAESSTPISLLSPAAIIALPDIPLLADPNPPPPVVDGGNALTDAEMLEASSNIALAQESYVLLMRCGQLPLAIASTIVHSTVLNPEIQPSTLAGGFCLGSISFADLHVPAVDLTGLCGLGAAPKSTKQQAFVISYPQGLVAFMVDEIMDVVPADPNLAVPIPRQALARPEFFAGALPDSALPAHAAHLPNTKADYYLLLDSNTLVERRDLLVLSTMNTASDGRVALRGEASADATNDADHAAKLPGKLLTYDLGGNEVATPIDQITEILPWADSTALLGDSSPAMGLMMNRGRAIPTFCLSKLTSQPRAPQSPTASVLVVEHHGEVIGFTVPRLISIDEARWAPQEDIAALAQHAQANATTDGVNQCWGRIVVGNSDGERMLNLLDLHHLALTLLGPAPSAALQEAA